MIVAIDFDGTIVHNKFPKIGEPIEGAIDGIRALKKQGCYLIIWTCRCGDDLINAINWLVENNVPFDRINSNHPANVNKYNSDSRKINADVYVDDHNIGGFIGWKKVVDIISMGNV